MIVLVIVSDRNRNRRERGNRNRDRANRVEVIVQMLKHSATAIATCWQAVCSQRRGAPEGGRRASAAGAPCALRRGAGGAPCAAALRRDDEGYETYQGVVAGVLAITVLLQS